MRMEEYLSVVTEQIRCKKARGLVGDELKEHILEQAEAYEAEGMFEEEALERAVKDMGDPVETGVSLDRIHRPQMSWGALALIAAISLFGIAVHMALFEYNVRIPSTEHGPYLKLHLLYTIVGYLLMLLVYRLDYSVLSGRANLTAAAFLGFVLCGIRFDLTVNGARNWVAIGPIVLSLRMLMCLYVPLYGALLYQHRGEGYRGVGKLLLWSAAPVWIALQIPSGSLAVALCVSFLLLFSVAVWKGWYLANRKRTLAVLWGTILSMPFLLYGILPGGGLPDYQAQRLRHFLSGNLQYDYYAGMVLKSLEGSRLLGGSEKNIMELAERLPGYNSDYILVSLIAVYGLLAGMLAVALLVFLIAKVFRISLRQRNQLGMMLGCGCGIVFSLQLALCVAVNLSLLPATSVTLPFLSYGGTGTVVFYLLLGLALSVYRHKNILSERSAKKAAKGAPAI